MNDWQQALHHFQALTGNAPTIHRLASKELHAAVGAWWSSGGEAPDSTFDCVKVSANDYAVFASPVDNHLRDALTWMLRADGCETAEGRTTLGRLLQDWLRLPDLHVVAAVTGTTTDVEASPVEAINAPAQVHSPAETTPAEWARRSGYLLWLRIATPASGSDICASDQTNGDVADLRAVVGDVLDAFAPGGWREWGDHGVLLWVADDIIAEYSDRDDDFAATGSGGLTRAALIRRFAAGLLQVLEEDALATATVCVSQRWHSTKRENAHLDAVLASLVLAARAQATGLRRDRIAVFGEQTLVHAIQAMTQSGRQMLAKMSGDLTQAMADDEVSQTLQAMMEANLNVSEAARLLFVHRNTLIHRLERIRETTGRDLRRFDDAASLLMSLLAQRARESV